MWQKASLVLLEYRQRALRHKESERRAYQKSNRAYWNKDIIETRQKRAKACFKETENAKIAILAWKKQIYLIARIFQRWLSNN